MFVAFALQYVWNLDVLCVMEAYGGRMGVYGCVMQAYRTDRVPRGTSLQFPKCSRQWVIYIYIYIFIYTYIYIYT